MEEMVGLVSTCGRELLWGWWQLIDLMLSFMIFTASVWKVLDTPLYTFTKYALAYVSYNCNTMGGGWLKLHLLKIQGCECVAISINYSFYI
jgi:hypothetical protein